MQNRSTTAQNLNDKYMPNSKPVLKKREFKTNVY